VEVSTFFKKLFSGRKGIDIGKRFDLMGACGPGSMSKVYRARDRKIGRTICLKVLDKEKTARFEARFPKLSRPAEGAILMSLRHRNVVQAFDHGLTTRGEQFIVMELVEGPGLNFLIETRNASLNGKRVDYLVQTADGLEYVHQHGFLHRDICPRNIMVDQEGNVKLIDFGLTIPYRPEFCKPGNRTGTPNYLAPEIIKRVTTDNRVDLFALGVTAYEVFTGELPWEKSRSLETLLKHINTAGRNPREYVPDMDEALANFLIKAIKRDPKERFQSALAFREALKALPRQDY
jgi:eukaryotic-like serine/threonine-protein kinase